MSITVLRFIQGSRNKSNFLGGFWASLIPLILISGTCNFSLSILNPKKVALSLNLHLLFLTVNPTKLNLLYTIKRLFTSVSVLLDTIMSYKNATVPWISLKIIYIFRCKIPGTDDTPIWHTFKRK